MKKGRFRALRYAITCKNIVQRELEVNLNATTRRREVVYSKIIFTRLISRRYNMSQRDSANKVISQDDLGTIVNKDRCTVIYYFGRFDVLHKYDDFKAMYNKVSVAYNSIYEPKSHVSSGEFYLNMAANC